MNDRKSACGAGGQLTMIFEEPELAIVVTAHTKGMGETLRLVPEKMLPSFVE